MLEDLKYLVELQEIDLRIKEQELAQEHFPAEVVKLNSQIEDVAATLSTIKDKLTQAQTDKSTWEEQVQKAQIGLEKSQERLNSIRTNREYDAVHAEIETQKGIINSAEQRRNALTSEIEKLQNDVAAQQAELDRITSENRPKIDELQSKIDAIDSNIAKIVVEREKLTPKIGKHILRQYDLIHSKRKNGRVLSIITSTRTCSVCYKMLEPQLFNEIRRSNKLILCQSCGSIMIWQQNETMEQ